MKIQFEKPSMLVRAFVVAFCAFFVLSSVSAFGLGNENLTTQAAAAVSVHRAVPQKAKEMQDIVVENYGLKVHPVRVVARHKDGTIFADFLTHNIRTTAGGDAQASQMGNTSTQAAACNFVAVTNDSGAPASGDTTLASEIASNGLSRAQGTYAHTAGTASFTVSKTFSATGTQASQKTGLFNASSAGTLCFEATYTAVTVNNGDSLTITWTINY